MAPFTIEGSCNRIVLEIWLEGELNPSFETRADGSHR